MSENLPGQLSGEEFGQSDSLTLLLHRLVRSYPKGVGLILEFLQNADDAGARSLRVFLDDRTHPTSKLPTPAMRELQGPALIFINDARFSKEDWENIQKIGNSGKALDVTKTGRFGLGFNSVYNATDFPMTLTGSRIGIFDPHGHTVHGATPEHPGRAWRLDSVDLWSQWPDLLAPFDYFGLTSHASEFSTTAFRLPLRTPAQATVSDICREPYTRQDFDFVVGKLRNHLSDLLLFLRNVQDIDISYIDCAGNERLLLSAHTVNRDVVDEARSRIRQALATDHTSFLKTLSGPNPVNIVSEFEHHVDFTDTDGSQSRNSYLVVNGLFCDTKGAIAACAQQMHWINEKAVPLAGAARRLDVGSLEGFKGRLFCTLPLPLASPLPFCHVNGFFDLQEDRQGLFQDEGAGGSSAVRVKWNRLLLEHCCSEAAARLCSSVSQNAQKKAQPLYEHWPRISAQEQAMLDALPRQTYQRLLGYKCIAAAGDSTWHLPKDVQVLPSKASETVRMALLSDVFPLPNPVLPDFVSVGFKAAGAPLSTLLPATVRASLKGLPTLRCQLADAPRRCLRDAMWIRALLEFCAADGKIDDLLGVPLAHMSDGTLRAFGRTQGALIYLAGEVERAIFARRSAWFIDSSLEALGVLKESNLAGIFRFTPQSVVANLGNVLPNAGPDVRISAENIPSESWLCEVFEYLTAHAGELKVDNTLFAKLPMIPDQSGSLRVMGTAKTPLLPGTDDSIAIKTAVTRLGVPLVSGGEKLLKAIRGFVDAFPGMGVWRLSPRNLIDTLSAIAPKDPSLAKAAPMEDATTILDYLSARGLKDLKIFADRVPKLRSLFLFPASSGQIVSLDAGDHYIPANFVLPEFATEVGLLKCGPDQQWLHLYKALNVQELTRNLLLTKILLPRISDLHDQDIYHILLWLRTNWQNIQEEESKETADELLSRLRDALPIHCTDGKLRPPGLLYHPASQFAASLLGNGVGFPNLSIYNERSDLWLAFFETLGMVSAPRPNDIINAIDGILVSEQPYEAKAARLSDIWEYVDQHWDEIKEQTIVGDILQPEQSAHWHLRDALSHRAWLPAIVSAPREYPPQLLLTLTARFFKPSEMLAHSALDLAGSIRPICQINGHSKLQNDIRLKTEPKMEDVLAHFENALSVAATNESPVSDHLVLIFKRVYAFLGRQFENVQPDKLEADPRVIDTRRRFALRPCLVDENRHVWPPEHCFADSVSSFLGRRARVRAQEKNVDRGLQVLGRKDRPRVSDYVAFFNELIKAQGGTPIPEVDRDLLRRAYHNAVLIGEKDSFRGCPILLETGELVKADVAVLDDAPWLSERARSARLRFLDPLLGEAVAMTFGVPLLSSAVYERPEQEHRSHDSKFCAKCAQLQATLRSSQFHIGVYRLLKASDAMVRETDLRHFFKDLHVISVSTLATTLVWTDGKLPVERSSGPGDVVFDRSRNGVVVSENADDVFYDRIGDVLSNELRLDDHDLGKSAGNFVAILRVAPDAIDRHLTKLRVRALPAPSAETMDNDSDDLSGVIDGTEEWRECETDPPTCSSDIGTDHISEASKEGDSVPFVPHDDMGPETKAKIAEDDERGADMHTDSIDSLNIPPLSETDSALGLNVEWTGEIKDRTGTPNLSTMSSRADMSAGVQQDVPALGSDHHRIQRVIASGVAPQTEPAESATESWVPECAPGNAGTGKIRKFAPRTSTVSVRAIDPISQAHSSITNNSSDEPRSSTSLTIGKDAQKIGAWGEEWLVVKFLPAWLKQEFEGSIVRHSPSGCEVLVGGSVVASILWPNCSGERYLPYDIIVKRESRPDLFVEVKSTSHAEMDLFEISRNEWDLAAAKQDNYHIYRVYCCGSADPEVKVIDNPYGRWQRGELEASPVRLCL